MKFLIKIIYLLILFMAVENISAQTQLSGVVVIDFANRDAGGVYILNQNKNVYTQSDLSGHFTILASVGDSILFDSDFLEKRYFKVTPKALTKKDLVIHLNMEKLTLKELVIRPKLTGDYRKDMAHLPKDETVEKLYASLGIDIRTLDIKPEEKKEEILPAITKLNIDALYKELTGYYRKMDNLRTYDRNIQKIDKVKEYLGDSFFTDYLQIPKEEIYQFLVYVQGHYLEYDTHLQNKDFFSLQKLLLEKTPEYMERIRQRDSNNHHPKGWSNQNLN